MDVKSYLRSIGITQEGNIGDDNAYVIDLVDSDDYGKMFSRLERVKDLDLLEDNQVITEQGSSLMYESESEPYLLNLIADFDGDVYQLVVNEIKDE